MRTGSKILNSKIFQTSNQSKNQNDRSSKRNLLETSQTTMYGVYGIDLLNMESIRSRTSSGSLFLLSNLSRSSALLNSPLMMTQLVSTTLKMTNLMFTKLQKLEIPYTLMDQMFMIQNQITKWKDINTKGSRSILILKSFGRVINLQNSRSGALLMLRNPSSENGSVFKSETLMASLICIKQLLRNMEIWCLSILNMTRTIQTWFQEESTK